MASELKLQMELTEVSELQYVYFQPPASLLMNYPCVKYSFAAVNVKHANNKIYKNKKRYEIIVIDFNPDSTIYEKILYHFPLCSLDRIYVYDNLYHFVLTLYY